jgi:predicted transcriptional regulator
MPSSTPPMTVRFSEKARANMDRLAKMTNRSRSFIVNEAVEQYVGDRIAYLEDLDKAVASLDARPTYDADAVFGWMRTWGTKDEKPANSLKPVNR